MPYDRIDLAALLGSRICHDLISPLGAIGNGVELLTMSGATPGPELALISESVTSANARIRFFRIAFGAAEPEQTVKRAEILSILSDMTRGGRLNITWQAVGDPSRCEAKIAFLALQCLESALPFGGRIVVGGHSGDGTGGWRITAEAERMTVDPALWRQLEGAGPAGPLAAAQVQFALLPDEAARQGRRVTTEIADRQISIRY